MREAVATFKLSLRELFDTSEAELMTVLDEPPSRFEPVVRFLRGVAERAAVEGETVEVGRWLWTKAQAEVGIYLRSGGSVGAVLAVTWRRSDPASCEVRVGPISALSARAQWAAAVPSAVLGFAGARALMTHGLLASGVLRVAAGLLLAIVIWIALIALIVRTGLFMNVDASREVAARLRQKLARKLEKRAKRAKAETEA